MRCRVGRMEGTMPAIVAYPSVVEELVRQFGAVFPNEPSRRHFADYLTGLLVAARLWIWPAGTTLSTARLAQKPRQLPRVAFSK